MAHTFEDLVTLERAAVQARADLDGAPDYAQAWRAWRDAAAAFQAAVTAHAKDEGTSRVELEMAVKEAVRHVPAEAPAA
ncbi:hypothetical protein [Streptomyces sp. NPDC057257]|uniref:hypothetical protein n=1 Tax=Streptomyces sp. NPDC057257 TaxID=3346071 RepID=UPI00363D5504